MVHRPADSRLLVNLLSHERDYSKHLANLLEHSQLSLASFSAYASASSPPLAQAIITVAGALSGADDALRKYAFSVESWQAQLKALKDLEDEVGNIMRDREILVTRLIKASKSQKSSRDSIVGSTPSPSSSSLTVRLEVPVGAKLGAAQTELQACEAHLATKERELEEMRIRAITIGLQARCKAMVECGWVWGEMGKEGLRALESGDMATANGNGIGTHMYPHPSSNSDSGHAASDLSSLAPSQSASQLNDGPYRSPSPPPKPLPHVQAYRLSIPPAHSIDEHAVPDGRPKGAPRASWRISEVPEPDEEAEGGGSSADEDEAGLEVHENERFAKGRPNGKGKEREVESRPFSIRSPASGNASLPPPSPSTDSGSLGKRERHRSGSASLFGRAIGALFHRDAKEKERGSSLSPSKSSPSKIGGWRTRTDSNIAKVRGGKGGGESSDDEEQTRQLYSTWSPNSATVPKSAPVVLGASASTSSVNTTSKGSLSGQRLRKAKRSSVQAPPRARDKEATEKGWASDTAGGKPNLSRSGSASKQKGANTSTSKSKTKGKGSANGDATIGSGAKQQRVSAFATLEMNGGSVSRNSSLSRQSITSAASAPARMPTRSTTVPAVPHLATAASARSRAMSLQPAESLPAIPASTASSQAGPSSSEYMRGHRRTASTSSALPNRSGLTRSNDGPSLMSIVEGVARQNKDAWAAQDPNRKLIDVRAPPPVNVNAAFEEASKAAETRAQAESSSGHSTVPASGLPTKQSSPLLHHAKMSASASAPTLPASSSTLRPPMPLRSALRNNSRTPSPNPPPPLRGAPNDNSRDASPSRPMTASHAPIAHSKLAVIDKDDDATSISSYATGREDFDEDSTPLAEHAPEPSPLPPPPPPHDTIGSDVSGSSTTTEGAPTRRKSVRMSLPPTFSATPPAIDDDTDEEARGRHSPWGPSGQWSTRIHDGQDRDMWQDSDEEDEDYSRAKRLLTRMSRGRT